MLVNLVFRPFYRKSNSSVLLPPEVLICFSSVKSSSSTLIRCFDQMFFSSIPYWSATKIPIPGKFLHSSRFHFFLSFVASLFGSSQATLLPSIFAVFLSQCVYFTRPWFFFWSRATGMQRTYSTAGKTYNKCNKHVSSLPLCISYLLSRLRAFLNFLFSRREIEAT